MTVPNEGQKKILNIKKDTNFVAVKPTLLLIGPTPPPYHGVAVATQALLKSDLPARFHVAHLDLADRRGIQHVDRPDFHDVVLFIRQWVRMVAKLVYHRPDLVYIPISQSTVGFLRDSLFFWPSRLMGSRVVLHLHGGNFRAWYESRGDRMKAYVRSVLKRTARMVILGDSLKGLFDGLMPSRRIAVVPNGIEWPTSPSPERRASRTGPYRVLYVGTLSRQKGALVLLEAILSVKKVCHDIEFVLAGPWLTESDRRDAEAFMARTGLTEGLYFPGLVEGEAKRELFETADLFVFPAVQQEGQPLVVIEAMAAGLPILYTNRGCLRETVVDHEQGLEIEIGDPEDLSRKILWMADHPEEIKRMGANSRRRYEELYTASRFIRNMSDVFDHVLQRQEDEKIG
jgi:glycosyltransferase involved in cell wall biosynthesis